MSVLLMIAGGLMFLGLLVIVAMLVWDSASFVTASIGIIGGITMLGSGALLMLVWLVLFFIGILRR